MKCYSLLLGSRNTAGKGPRFLPRDDLLVRRITQRHFPTGFTILHARGGWFDATRGRFIREESRQILVCAKHRRLLAPWCRELGHALGQKELIVIRHGHPITFRIRPQEKK